MADHTIVNLKDGVEDMAPKFGMEGLESRFARVPLELQEAGLSYFKVAPGVRPPFGHRHGRQEEIYVLISGSARLKLDDEILELRQWDAVRIPGPVVRAFEGGPEGAELLAFGSPSNDNKDVEMLPNWWTD